MRFFGTPLSALAPHVLFLSGALVLAAQPLAWLLAGWSDPAFNLQGLWIALAALSLFAWSYVSEQQPGTGLNHRYAYTLLAVSALVRMLGQVLRINMFGALTLAVDVYALATLAGLRRRERPVSPFWLAVLFAFSLPVERVLQRLLGFGLQQLSAQGSCGLLGWLSDGVTCLGTRILLAGQDVLVDLPCSGARGLTLLLALYAALAALKRPGPVFALVGLALTLGGALAGNVLRLTALALGLAFKPFGIDFMAAPWHELLGLSALTIAAVPVLLWARPAAATRRLRGATCTSHGWPASRTPLAARSHRVGGPWAAAFLALAMVVVSLPARPLDVATVSAVPVLPGQLAGYSAQPLVLNATEQSYFTQYGGGAARAAYGPFALLLVSTSAPLRHLHAPDECLRGSGHAVRYAGLAQGALPSALYDSRDAQGQHWRVRVSYVSARGEHAASVAEAVWRWLQAPGVTWTMVQRIAPADVPIELFDFWDASALRALDLPVAPPTTLHRVSST